MTIPVIKSKKAIMNQLLKGTRSAFFSSKISPNVLAQVYKDNYIYLSQLSVFLIGYMIFLSPFLQSWS